MKHGQIFQLIYSPDTCNFIFSLQIIQTTRHRAITSMCLLTFRVRRYTHLQCIS